METNMSEDTMLPSDRSFQSFLAWRAAKSDDDFRQLVVRGVLSRTDIARECQIAKSVLAQNPRVRKALKLLEDDLRDRNVLPKRSASPAETGEQNRSEAPYKEKTISKPMDRQWQLEQEIALLKAENAELKRLLSKHENLHDALVLTGRLPR
jgi:hypothetical protein